MTAVLAGANLWFTAARSTIPLAIDAVVVRREKRREKHPGLDDVYLISFQNGRTMPVDQSVFELAAEGARLAKTAWSRNLRSDGRRLALDWSLDFRRMLIAMPLGMCLTAVGLTYSLRGARRNEKMGA